MDTWIVVAILIGGVIIIFGGLAIIVAKFYRKVDQGQALIINKMKDEPEVTFTGGVVYPIIHRAESRLNNRMQKSIQPRCSG